MGCSINEQSWDGHHFWWSILGFHSNFVKFSKSTQIGKVFILGRTRSHIWRQPPHSYRTCSAIVIHNGVRSFYSGTSGFPPKLPKHMVSITVVLSQFDCQSKIFLRSIYHSLVGIHGLDGLRRFYEDFAVYLVPSVLSDGRSLRSHPLRTSERNRPGPWVSSAEICLCDYESSFKISATTSRQYIYRICFDLKSSLFYPLRGIVNGNCGICL